MVRQSPEAESGRCRDMPWSPRTAPSWALLLRLLALLRPPGLGEACSCAPAHPQQHVCRSALGESGGALEVQGRGWLCGVGAGPSGRPGVWREGEGLQSRTSCLLLGPRGSGRAGATATLQALRPADSRGNRLRKGPPQRPPLPCLLQLRGGGGGVSLNNKSPELSGDYSDLLDGGRESQGPGTCAFIINILGCPSL